ncbi:MAG: hypothetical protein MRERV_28c026 [Mycoplasmataceae bacterium RV_VA103A]|nr:MAG: hypothetical protein MRERV_28c026 [Mycoplasmataceae bacterium RV_VA103A]
MVEAQKWLDEKYPSKGGRKKVEEIYMNSPRRSIEGHLDLNDFVNLKKLVCSNNNLTSLNNNNLTSLNIKSCPDLEYLDCGSNSITDLDISGCPNITYLDCRKNKLSELDLSKCSKIMTLKCEKNRLTSLNFLKHLDDKKLKRLDLNDNNFLKSNLDPFSRFTNLEILWLCNKEGEAKKAYNRFFGSLKPLQNLNKLQELYIQNTDLDSGLEYLSDSINTFYCDATKRPESKVKKIEEELNECASEAKNAKKEKEKKEPSNFLNRIGERAKTSVVSKVVGTNFADHLKVWKKANPDKIIIVEQSKKLKEKDDEIKKLTNKLKELEQFKELYEKEKNAWPKKLSRDSNYQQSTSPQNSFSAEAEGDIGSIEEILKHHKELLEEEIESYEGLISIEESKLKGEEYAKQKQELEAKVVQTQKHLTIYSKK